MKKRVGWLCLLTLLMLAFMAGCADEEPGDTEPAQKTVTVSTVEELAAAIDNDTRIVLKDGTYNLSKLDGTAVSNPHLREGVYMEDQGDYILYGVHGLTLEAENAGQAEIVTENIYAVPLSFVYCSDITLRGLVSGHEAEPGACSGSVVRFERSGGIRIENCRLYGCGTYGLEARQAENIMLIGTEIYECAYGVLDLCETENALFYQCEFYHNNGMSLFNIAQCREVMFEDTEVYENYAAEIVGYEPILVSASQNVSFWGCTFRDNVLEPDPEALDTVVFENCQISH